MRIIPCFAGEKPVIIDRTDCQKVPRRQRTRTGTDTLRTPGALPADKDGISLEYKKYEHNAQAAALVGSHYDTPPLAYVHSYGCQQNVNDGERIKGVLVDIGYGLCDNPEDADLILFNTCAVRGARRTAGVWQRGGPQGPEREKAGPHHRPVRLHGQPEAGGGKTAPQLPLCGPGPLGWTASTPFPACWPASWSSGGRILLEPAQRPVIVEGIPIRRESEFRAWLPIMYGCDNFCTYCIVPYVRGREKSRRPADILAEFKGWWKPATRRSPCWARERQQLRQGAGRGGEDGLLRPAQPAVRRAGGLPHPLHDQPPPRTPAAS